MDAGTAIGVAVAAAAVAILLAIFLSFWICRRIRKRDDGNESSYGSASYQEILEQNDRELPYAVERRIERKKGVGFYEGSQNAPPRNPPPKP